MGSDDRGQGRLVCFRPDMEQPGPRDLTLADTDRGISHALGAKVGRATKDRRKQRWRKPNRVACAQMRKQIGEVGPRIDLGQKVSNVDLGHVVEYQPFC